MYFRLLKLEIKNFFRNPQFGANLAMKILMGFAMAYFSLVFIGCAFGLFFFAREEMNVDPVLLLSKYFLYYWVIDLMARYFIQQMPTQNIKPFLTQNITKKKLVNYTILKTFFHFFNWGYLLFLIPFGILMLVYDYSVLSTFCFLIGILFMFYFSNFLNILLNGKANFVIIVFGLISIFAALEYFGIIKLSDYSEQIFYSFFNSPGLFLIPVALTFLLAYIAYRNIYKNFYLDQGLEAKKVEGKTENIEFLNRFGQTGIFLNNDIRLLKRSKAAQSAALGGVLFLFYGLLFFNSAYQNDFMKFFAGIFVTGGFMMMFGQRVPAWDSSYYPLMITQNVPYKEYLKAKWALLVMAIAVSMILGLAYALISWEFYFIIFAGGLYNLGANSYFTLWAGAYNKQGIDLNARAKSFGGGKNSFNLKTILMLIPQILLPGLVFAIVKYFFGMVPAVAAIGFLGLLGFLLREKIFDFIVKIYKSEKYSTIQAFKQV